MKDLVKIFKACSDSTRLRIMRLLLERELCVCELMFILKMEQSRISHHLRILRDANLVEDVREGKWITYRIADKVRQSLKPLFQEFLREKLKNSKEVKLDIKNLKVCVREEIRKRLGSKREDD